MARMHTRLLMGPGPAMGADAACGPRMLARRLGRSRPFSQSLPSGKVNTFLISSQERSAGDQAAWRPCAGRCCASAWLCRIQKPGLLPPQQAARHVPTSSSTFSNCKRHSGGAGDRQRSIPLSRRASQESRLQLRLAITSHSRPSYPS